MAEITLSKEEEAALRIQSMLQGVSLEELARESFGVDDDDDFDIVIEDEEPKKKKGTRKKSEPHVAKLHVVPELDKYARLRRNLTMDVSFGAHDIPYKEQLWAIPSRVITYNLELVKSTMESKRSAERFSKDKGEIERADNGEVRYYRLVNYENNVPYTIKCLAYVRVEEKNGKMLTRTIVEKELLKKNHANADKVTKNLNQLVRDIEA